MNHWFIYEEDRSKIRSQKCTINILHAMLKGEKSAVCYLNSPDELKLQHPENFEVVICVTCLKARHKID